MNKNPTPILIGKWNWNIDNDLNSSIVHYYSHINLVGNKNNSVVLSGWSFSGWNNKILHPINIAIIDQDSNGGMYLNTEKYILDPKTNGSGSVLVSDFNNDGFDDIFLAAFNETPALPTNSTAYISQPDGTLKKVEIADSIEAHSASIGQLEGKKTIVTAGGYSSNPFYQFNSKSGNFDISVWKGAYEGKVYGQSSILSDLDGNGNEEIVIGDLIYGPGYPYVKNTPNKIAIYNIENNGLAKAPSFISNLYFDQERYLNKGLISNYGGLSHNYRIWSDDFNYDGLADLLLGVGVWSTNDGWQKNKLQMLQNEGAFKFNDVTDKFGSAYDENTSFVDYSTTFLDIDNSGINSYLLAGNQYAKGNQQSNYLLINDGTGQLYAAIHNEFQVWAQSEGFKFIGFLNSDGAINYLGITGKGALYNFKVDYKVTTDFVKDIYISDRNQSKLIRTWAGNDVFQDSNHNISATKIDGGLGLDISIYKNLFNQFKISKNLNNQSIHIESSLQKINDTLFNIERVAFKDISLAFDISGNAGTTAKILGAVFGKDSVSNKNYFGIGLNFLDAGWTYDNLAGLALDAAGAKTNDQIVSLLWTNVIGTTPTAAEKQPFITLLENGMTAGALAHLAADTSFNTTNINLVGLAQTGIEYIPVS
jgi:hypothetical protein